MKLIPYVKYRLFAIGLGAVAIASISAVLTGCGKAASGDGTTGTGLALTSTGGAPGGTNSGTNAGGTPAICDLKVTNKATGLSLLASTESTTDVIHFTVGDNAQFDLTTTPTGLTAFWFESLNGVTTMNDVFAGPTPYTQQHAYLAAEAGTVTRFANVEDDNGNVVCTTRSVTVVIAATGAGTPGLVTDKVMYKVGDTPLFTLTGAPANTSILWSSTRNGASTGEVNVNYGHKTDVNGKFQSYGGTWSATNVGLWTKTAKVGVATFSVNFQVSN